VPQRPLAAVLGWEPDKALSEPPEVHTFPSDDERFRAAVIRTMERYHPPRPMALAELLREAYPAVDVRARDTLAHMAGWAPLWYAFRDGEQLPAAAST
jgi:hypothetical protein